MQLPPLAVTAHWPQANYVDPVQCGPGVLVTVLLLTTLATMFVALRMYTRIKISHCYGMDDMLLLLALMPTIGHSVIVLLATYRFGGNRHIWDVPLDDLISARKLNLGLQILFAAACTLTKASMVLLTRRLMGTSLLYKKITELAIVVIAGEGVIFCFVSMLQCIPLKAYWTIGQTNPKCLNQTQELMVSGVINTITDFMVVLLPIPIVWNLQLAAARRIELTSLLAVGFLVCCAGILRNIYTYQLTQTWDPSWTVRPVFITSTVELDVGIMCASLPGMNPLLRRCFGNSGNTRFNASGPSPMNRKAMGQRKLATRGDVNTNVDSQTQIVLGNFSD